MDQDAALTPEQLEKVHQCGQEILDVFVQICEENGFKYYLMFGTLLGAVRHGGPIPWDDDVDVVMPREDMEAFRKLMLSRGSVGKYHIHCRETDPNLPWFFIRLCKAGTLYLTKDNVEYGTACNELWIDIFPLDELPRADGWKYSLRNFHVRVLQRLAANKGRKNGFDTLQSKLLRILLTLVSEQWLRNRAEILMRKWNGRKDNKYYVVWCVAYSTKKTFEKQWFEPVGMLLYSGKSYRVPGSWDKALKRFYGDYMQLPAESERRIKHNPRAVKL